MENKRFLENIFRWVNLNELVFDAAIAGISMILYHILAPVSGFLLFDTDPLVMLPIMGVSEFCIMLFFGQIYRVFNEENLNPPRVLSALSDIILFIAINGIFFLMPALMASVVRSIPDIAENIEFALVPISGAFIILGITFGFPRRNLKDIEPLLSLPLAITALMGVISVLFVLFTYGVIPGIIYILFIGGALLLNRLLLLKPEKEAALRPVPKIRAGRVIAGIIVPIAVVFALMVWQELIVVRSVTNALAAGETLTPWNIVVLMTLSGLIPVRILAILAPPIRPINAGIAVISMFFYFLSIAAAIKKLSAIL
jgi:hypothetical protein